MPNDLASRNNMVNWQVAPGCHEISNYDDVKIKYRQSVHEIIDPLPDRSLKRMVFVTIATNVLCADTTTSVTKSRHVDPIERDIYLPLEISLTKASVSDSNKNREERMLNTIHYIINPGPPPANGSVKWSKDHKESTHKIDYEKFRPNDTYLESDMRKIVKEINQFLTPEKIVYSSDLRTCRQDLGCLKWLNRETNFIMKPVKVFSVEDLYVVLNRRLYPKQVSQGNLFCQGIAHFRFEHSADVYEPENQCRYHQDKLKEDDLESTNYCAKAISESRVHTLLDDIFNFKLMEEDITISANADATSGH